MAFLPKNDEYYEGERANIDDIKVPIRPSIYHKYDRDNKIWILDDKQFTYYKKIIIERINIIYKEKIELLSLSNGEKEELRNMYDILINQITNAKTVEELQNIVID